MSCTRYRSGKASVQLRQDRTAGTRATLIVFVVRRLKGSDWRGWRNLAAYRRYFVLLCVSASAEVAFRVLIPWPMQIVVDNALGSVPPAAWIVSLAGHTRVKWLVFAVAAGIFVQAVHQAVLM